MALPESSDQGLLPGGIFMETIPPERIRGRLRAEAASTSKKVVTLLKYVAKLEKASLQAVAVELWDAIQWGELELAGQKVTVPNVPLTEGHSPMERDIRDRQEPRRDNSGAHVRRRESQIDRDRILQSWSFRRLEGVTQIVTPDHSGHLMHSRLTHSLKVAQVGRRIAEEFLLREGDAEMDPDLIAKGGGLDPNIVEAAGLAHDIGHPPFGHAGEDVLKKWANDMELADGFEGNAQTLRMITRHEFRFCHREGMNLTNATKAAVIKYPWRRERPGDGPRSKKFNAYDDDHDDHLEKPRAALNVTGDVQTLEASIMDLADDINYALHDLEDFYTAGLFRRNHIVAILDDYSDNQRGYDDPPTTYQYRDLEDCKKDLADKRGDVYSKALFDQAVDKVLTLVRFSMYRQFDGSRPAYALIRTAFASRVDFYIPRITVDKDTGMAKPHPEDWHEIQVLKWLTSQFVHSRSELAITQHGQAHVMRAILCQLYTWCMECGTDKKRRAKLPITLQELTKDAHDQTTWARAVIDYVCLLTDAQLHSLGRALRGSGAPSTLHLV
jgi:dGTPase